MFLNNRCKMFSSSGLYNRKSILQKHHLFYVFHILQLVKMMLLVLKNNQYAFEPLTENFATKVGMKIMASKPIKTIGPAYMHTDHE